jgi:hypothetical protein
MMQQGSSIQDFSLETAHPLSPQISVFSVTFSHPLREILTEKHRETGKAGESIDKAFSIRL